MQISQKTGPSAYEPEPSGATSPRPISSPPARPKCWMNSAGIGRRVELVRSRDLDELPSDVLGGALHGEARDRRRAARAGRAVVRREARIGAAHRRRARPSSRAPPPRSARTRCARPGRARSSRRARSPRRRPPCARSPSRPGGRPPRAGRPRRRGRRSAPFGSPQPTARAAFSTSPMMSASSGLPPARTSSPRRAQVGLADGERIEPDSGGRARRSAARRSTAGGSRRTRGRSPTARCSCRRTRRRRGRPRSGTGRARRHRRSRSRAVRCRRRRPCRTSTRPRARAGAPRSSSRCACAPSCRGAAT